jgi:hypothetical protein
MSNKPPVSQVHIVSDGTPGGVTVTVDRYPLEVIGIEWRQRWDEDAQVGFAELELPCPNIDVVGNGELYTTINGKRYRLVEAP